jgi:hypothetical protein
LGTPTVLNIIKKTFKCSFPNGAKPLTYCPSNPWAKLSRVRPEKISAWTQQAIMAEEFPSKIIKLRVSGAKTVH